MSATTPPIDEPTSSQPTGRARAFLDLSIDLFDRHNLLGNASAISFQALKALVPLTLFALALPGVLGVSDIWESQFKEGVSRQFTPTASVAIDTAVQKIVTERSAALPAFAGALLLWYVSGLVRACMGALNSIYDIDDRRSVVRRWSLSLVLAAGVIVAAVAAMLAVTTGPRIDRGGTTHVLLMIVRWPVAAIALGLAVGLLVHYGPGERRRVRWASVGAVVIVTAWIGQSSLFAWYVDSYANFKSASGALTVFLVLAAYLYAASIIFLIGVELDELLRKDASSSERGLFGLLRRGGGYRTS